jgi:ribosome modulation factor
MEDNDYDKCFEEGYDAYSEEAVKKVTNPYQIGTKEYGAWEDGMDEAEIDEIDNLEESQENAFNEGFDAQRDGKLKNDNPYLEQSIEYNCWLDGWELSEEEDKLDEDM